MPTSPSSTETASFSWSYRAPHASPDWVLQVAWPLDDARCHRQLALAPGDPHLTLGRGVDVFGRGVLEHRGLSRAHAILTTHEDHIRVADAGARNGMHVDGKRVEEARLVCGSVLSLPGIHLVVRRGTVRAESVRVPPSMFARGDWLEELSKNLRRWGPQDDIVLLLGETGTGKLEVARALQHFRRKGRLVRVNASRWRGDTWKSEFFGHVRGAFTGAIATVRGAIERAGSGTLFIDEIGRMPLAAQEALLTLLDGDRTWAAVGEAGERRMRARVVAASDLSLDDAECFVPALRHRLSQLMVELPPLRERREDIIPLALAAGLGRADIDHIAALALLSYTWPGNVRELQNIARMAADADDPRSAIHSRLKRGDGVDATGDGDETTSELRRHARCPATLGELEAVIRKHRTQGAAALALGVSRSTLGRWLARLRKEAQHNHTQDRAAVVE